MLTDGYHKAARALAPALRENSTFTKAWFLTQEHMTSSFWRALSVDGLRANDGYVAVGGDVAGKKRGHLLAIMPADEEGASHLGRDDRDRGTQAYRVTPLREVQISVLTRLLLTENIVSGWRPEE